RSSSLLEAGGDRWDQKRSAFAVAAAAGEAAAGMRNNVAPPWLGSNSNLACNSLPRTARKIMNGTAIKGEQQPLDGALLQMLSRSDVGASAENLLFAGSVGSFRRLGSGRRSVK